MMVLVQQVETGGNTTISLQRVPSELEWHPEGAGRITPDPMSEPPAISFDPLFQDSSALASFPFSLTAGLIALAGIALGIWGIIVLSAWISLVGLTLTLAGLALYGWVLCD